MARAVYSTVLALITNVAAELGLPPPVGEVLGNEDPNVNQLAYLLKGLGRRLILENEWLQLRKTHSFVTGGGASYALPVDFLAYVDQTGWNNSSRMPLVPVSPQRWRAMDALGMGTVLPVLFRAQDATLEFPTGLTTGQVIVFDYRSLYWVSALAADAAPNQVTVALNANLVWIDSYLMERGLKLAFLRAKGFDSSAAQDDYDRAMAPVLAASAQAAPKLSMSGRRTDFRYLDEYNVPASGFGGGLDSGGLY